MRTQGKHAGLDRDRVLDIAVALIDSEGEAALSMRRLAGEVGVEAMTLYHHFSNKGGLEDAIVEHVLASQEGATLPNGAPWQDVLCGYARMIHRALATHPGVVRLVATRPAMTERNVREVEALLEAFTTAGLSVTDALKVVHTAGAMVLGLHIAHPSDARRTIAPDLSATPRMQAALEHGAGDLDAKVEFALTTLIAGLESRS